MNSNIDEQRIRVWVEAYLEDKSPGAATKKASADAALAAFDATFGPRKDTDKPTEDLGRELLSKFSPILQRRLDPEHLRRDVINLALAAAYDKWWMAASNSVEEVIWYKVRAMLGYSGNVRDLVLEDLPKVRELKWKQLRRFTKLFKLGTRSDSCEASWLLYLCLDEIHRGITDKVKETWAPKTAPAMVSRVYPDLRKLMGTAEETDDVINRVHVMARRAWRSATLGSRSESVWAYILSIVGAWDYEGTPDEQANKRLKRFSRLTLEDTVAECESWKKSLTELLQSDAPDKERLAAGVVRVALRFTRTQLEKKENEAKEAALQAAREELSRAQEAYLSCCRRFHNTIAGTSVDASTWADLVKAREHFEKLRKAREGQ